MGRSPGAIHRQPCQMQRQPDTAQSPFLISSSFFPCPKRSWSQPSCSLGIQLLIHKPRGQLVRQEPNPGHTGAREAARSRIKPFNVGETTPCGQAAQHQQVWWLLLDD